MRKLGVALMVAAQLGISGTAFAQQPAVSGPAQAPGGIAGLLAGSAVPSRDLGLVAARGLPSDMSASVQGNANLSGGGGQITNQNALNKNTGITTIFQNTGNNSLFQNQTVVNISIH